MSALSSRKVKDFAQNKGADLVGVASACSFEEAPEGYRPGDVLRGARSVISLALRYSNASLEDAPSRQYAIAYNVVNRELDRLAYWVSRMLQDEGFRALHVPASPPYDLIRNHGELSHKHAASLAGIGVFGKNDLLLAPQFGSRIRLVSVITDATLDPDEPLGLDLCGNCDACLCACPVKALQGDRVVDKKACDARHIEVGKLLQLSDWEQICGVCIRVCPLGHRVERK